MIPAADSATDPYALTSALQRPDRHVPVGTASSAVPPYTSINPRVGSEPRRTVSVKTVCPPAYPEFPRPNSEFRHLQKNMHYCARETSILGHFLLANRPNGTNRAEIGAELESAQQLGRSRVPQLSAPPFRIAGH